MNAEIIGLWLITFAGGTLQGLTGFGSVLIGLPLLSLIFPLKTIIPLIALLAFTINLTLTAHLHRHVRKPALARLLVFTLPGVPLGVWALATIRPSWLEALIGALLLAFCLHGALQAVRKGCRPAREPGTGWAALAGFFAGFLGGSIGANGPPIIVFTALQPHWTKDEIKSTMLAYFLCAGVVICASHAGSGLVTGEVLKLFGLGAPTLLLGVFTGQRIYSRLAHSAYTRLVYVLLFGLGVAMLARAL